MCFLYIEHTPCDILVYIIKNCYNFLHMHICNIYFAEARQGLIASFS